MNIAKELYDIIWELLFTGELPTMLQNVAEEVTTILTIVGITIAVLLPISLVYGFIKWIYNFIS